MGSTPITPVAAVGVAAPVVIAPAEKVEVADSVVTVPVGAWVPVATAPVTAATQVAVAEVVVKAKEATAELAGAKVVAALVAETERAAAPVVASSVASAVDSNEAVVSELHGPSDGR